MTYGYDPEATVQDADLELAAMRRQAQQLEKARAAGHCPHYATVGVSASGKVYYPEQEGLSGEQVRCFDCGEVFASDADLMEATEALLG
jgi:hypothetical protein